VIGLNKGDEKVEAVLVKDAQDIFDYIECRTPLPELNERNRERMRRLGHIFIDEGQFIDWLFDSVRLRMYQGFKFYITGLLRTWKMEPFSQIDRLLTLADDIHVMHGYCEVCGRDASENQRLVRVGRRLSPVDYSEPIIAVGGKGNRGAVKNEYQARCKDCMEIPGKPYLAYSFPRYVPPSTLDEARRRMR
jgi:thymidine kinase